MPQDFVARSNATLDKICGSATSVEEMKRQMHAALEQNGALVHDRDGNVVGQIAQPILPNTGRLSRKFYVVNDAFEVFADDDAGLDAKEMRIRNMYGQR